MFGTQTQVYMFYNGYDFGGEFIPTSYMKIKSK
jgi:hypothetical protein